MLLLFLMGWRDAYTLKIPNRYVAGLILWWLTNEMFVYVSDTCMDGGIFKAKGNLETSGIFMPGCLFRILGAAAIAALVLLVSVLFRLLTKRKGIGAGDIKLFFVITLYIGFGQGLILILVSCIFAVINLLCHAVKGHSTILNSARFFSYFPFGPSIVCAAVLVMMEAHLEKSCI